MREAHAALMQRDYIEAEKSCERYLRRSPEGVHRWDAWNRLLDIAVNVRHDRKAAMELLEAMLIEFAADTVKKRSIHMQLADMCRLERRYGRALALWTAVVDDKEAPVVERAEAYRRLGEVYLRRLEFELAKEALSYALALDIPAVLRGQCLYELAAVHAAMEEPGAAIKQLEAILALPEIPQAQHVLAAFTLADILEMRGQYAEALRLFTSIRTVYPNTLVVEQRIAYLKNPKPMRNATIPPPLPPVRRGKPQPEFPPS